MEALMCCEVARNSVLKHNKEDSFISAGISLKNLPLVLDQYSRGSVQKSHHKGPAYDWT